MSRRLSDFGTFVSAPANLLDDDDLGGGGLHSAHQPLTPSRPSSGQAIRPGGGPTGRNSGSQAASSTSSSSSGPIHITLPPRPMEIPDDWLPTTQNQTSSSRQERQNEPPANPSSSFSYSTWSPATFNGRSAPNDNAHDSSSNSPFGFPNIGNSHTHSPPRPTQRQRRLSSTRGPTSPAAIDDSSGRDIIFHPSSPTSTSSPIRTRLLDTLATTTKAAAKWRASIEHDFFDPPPPQPGQFGPNASGSGSGSGLGLGSGMGHASGTAGGGASGHLGGMGIANVTHSSPFATPEQLAGSYTAPAGAPGYRPVEVPVRRETVEMPEQVRLVGRRETTDRALEEAQAIMLHRHLPPRQRLSTTWSLAYSTDQHGASLGTLYRNTENRPFTSSVPSGSIVVVSDSRGGMFGAYVNEPLRKREGQYYGTGESFLFKFTPDRSSLRIYRWSGKNQYFALCESGFMSFGGGGTYGLLVDSTMSKGSSATCSTYENEVLCGNSGETVYSEKATRFNCIALEVWTTT